MSARAPVAGYTRPPLAGYKLLLTLVVVSGLAAMGAGLFVAGSLVVPKMREEASWSSDRAKVASACEVPVGWVRTRPGLVVTAKDDVWRRYLVTVPKSQRHKNDRNRLYPQYGEIRKDGTVVCRLG
jgi:hypothetical protein